MNRYILALCLLPALLTLAMAQSPLDELKKKIEAARGHDSAAALSDDKISAGLKEALKVSTGRAVALTGRPDGFLKNAAIKILLPRSYAAWARDSAWSGRADKLTPWK